MADALTWGGANDSKDYELFMEGETPISSPYSLLGHALTSPSQELSEPVIRTEVIKDARGVIKTRQRVTRPAEQLSLSFTMLFGDTLWTPALDRARRGGSSCRTMLFAKRNCPPSSDTAHVYIWDDIILNPPARVNDFITIDETTRADWSSELRAAEERVLYRVGGSLLNDFAALRSIAKFSGECAGCDLTSVPYADMIAVGGAGGATPLIVVRTADRFATATTLATPAASGSIGQCVITQGNAVLIGYANATGDAGGILFSPDMGNTFQDAPGITVPIRQIAVFNGRYVAVGGDLGAQATVLTSTDGLTWTPVTGTALPATRSLLNAAVDIAGGAIFVCGEDGLLLRGVPAGNSVFFSVITPPSATTTDLQSVAVFGQDHIAVGGAAGYYAESFDGGVTWVQPGVPGTADIQAIAGNKYRIMIGSGAIYVERSLLNGIQMESRPLDNGQTSSGNITSLAMLEDNYFIATTDAGNIVLWRPGYPNS